MVRKYTDDTTLAIGDGANDVAMIQAAHIGVGISGQEGRQAVMASDFAIAQFRFLRDLIIVHGHWAYYRLSNFIFYFLYKNALFVMILFWYQIYCAFSNQTPVTDINLILYGLIYTNLPIIIFCIFDRDIPRKVLVANPWLHEIGMSDSLFSLKAFGLYMADMLYQSVIITFFPIYSYWVVDPTALYFLGTPITLACIWGATFHLFMDTNSWTWLHHAGYWLSLLGYLPISIIFESSAGTISSGETVFGLSTPIFYFVCLLTIVLALLPRFTIMSYRALFHPSLTVQAREVACLERRARRRANVSTVLP